MITYHRRTLIPTTNDLNGESLANAETQPYWTLWQDHNVYNEVLGARLYIPTDLHFSPFFIFYGYSGERLFDLATDDWTWGSNTELEVPKLHTDLPDYEDTYHCVVTAGFNQYDVDMGAVFAQDHISADQQHVDGAVIAEWVSRDWNEEKTLTATPTGSETERWSFFELTNPRTNVPSWSKYQAFADNGGGYVLVVYGWRADPYENGDQLFKLYGNDNQLLVEGTDYETEPRVSSETSNPMWYDVDIDNYNTLVFIPYAVFNSKISGGQLTVRYTRMGTVTKSELEAAQAAGNIPVVVDQCGKTTYHQYGDYSDAEQYTGKPEEAAGLKVWLPFDESATLDKCGNAWVASGWMSIEDNALQMIPTSVLEMSGTLTLGGRDFTIDWLYGHTDPDGMGDKTRVYLLSDATLTNLLCWVTDQNILQFTLNDGTAHGVSGYCDNNSAIKRFTHHAIVYQHSEGVLYFFVDGRLRSTTQCTISATTISGLRIGHPDFDETYTRPGELAKFRIFNGVAVWTSQFDVPTGLLYD